MKFPDSLFMFCYICYDSSVCVCEPILIWVTIALMNQDNQKQVREENSYLANPSISIVYD